MSLQRRQLVIGLGNRYRGDDGVGLYAARLIRATTPEHVSVIEGISDAYALLERWSRSSNVFVIDCTVSHGKPGKIRLFDALHDQIPGYLFDRFSTHSISILEVIELAAALDRLPRSLIIYGIEGNNFSAEEGLSPSVELAAHFVARDIVNELSRQATYRVQRDDQNA